MIAAFWFVSVCSFRNRLRLRLRRLREPRYALAVLVGGFYFWTVLVRPRLQAPSARDLPAAFASEFALLPLAALVLAGLVVWWWAGGADRSALAFTPTEVQLLFPAPVSRRGLLTYKIARSQLPTLLNALVFALILGRGGLGPALARAVGFWLLFSTVALHRLGAALAREAALEHGGAGARRFGPALLLVAAGSALLVISVLRALPALPPGASLPEWGGALQVALEALVPRFLLAPFRAALAPAFPTDWAAWMRAAAISTLLLAAHLVWVLRSDAAFEEAAAEASVQRAGQLASGRGRGAAVARTARPGRVWFPLAPTGSPAVALIWKNVALVTGKLSLRALAVGGVLLIGFALVIGSTGRVPLGPGEMIGGAALLALAMLAAVGPFTTRNDLRADLLHLATLRSYPLSGRQVVGAEVAASAATLAAMELACLAVAYLASFGVRNPLVPGVAERTALLLGGGLLLPSVAGLGVLVLNGSTLLFPAWASLGTRRGSGGVENMGFALLGLVMYLLPLCLLLLIPAAAGLGVGWAARQWFGVWGWMLAAAVAAAVALAEARLMVRWLGGVWDRTDPSTAGIEGAGS